MCASVRPSIRCLPFVDLIKSVIGLTHSSAVFTGINENHNNPSTTPATTVYLRNRLTTTAIQMEIQLSKRALYAGVWRTTGGERKLLFSGLGPDGTCVVDSRFLGKNIKYCVGGRDKRKYVNNLKLYFQLYHIVHLPYIWYQTDRIIMHCKIGKINPIKINLLRREK